MPSSNLCEVHEGTIGDKPMYTTDKKENTRSQEIVLWRATIQKIEKYLWTPLNPAGLGVARILFGSLMFLDVIYERGLPELHERFGNPAHCHFPLFSWFKPLPLPWMGVIYSFMWLGTLGIALGYKFRLSCLTYIVTYWYIFLLNKVFWNNHSYLYGLLAILFLGTSANHYKSVDAILNPAIKDAAVPRWNYWILRFQIFLLYFYAGVKKWDPDWLSGYCMFTLGEHWVFSPFKMFLSEETINFVLVHIGGFLFDLTVGFFLLMDRTRPYGLGFAYSFHLMNSQLFSIGLFSYVCLAMLPIFCAPEWPCKIIDLFRQPKRKKLHVLSSTSQLKSCRRWQKVLTVLGIMSYVMVQLVLPFSHSITQGYAGWTPGLYGYSWDMMVHGWENLNVVITVEDESGNQTFINPDALVSNDRWSNHPDTIYQFAHCATRNLHKHGMRNFSVYVDIWKSLNGRLQQRLVDPRQNFVDASWSPWTKTSWILPLLDKNAEWRKEIIAQRKYWSSRGKNSLVVGDFPGLVFETAIPVELIDVELHVLEGRVQIEMKDGVVVAKSGDVVRILTDVFHKVRTVSDTYSIYLYTFKSRSKSPKKESVVHFSTFFEQHIRIFSRCCFVLSNSLIHLLRRITFSSVFEQENL